MPAEDSRRSLSDLRSNLETGLYSPATFGSGGGMTGVESIGGASEGIENIKNQEGGGSYRAVPLKRNNLNSSNTPVSGNRLA